jgi:hypothetical protein
MGTDRFDVLTRSAGSRRGILTAALGGIPLLGVLADATAKKRRLKKRCFVRLRPDTCPTIKTRSCRGKKQVKCQSGKICLANKSCGLNCAAADCSAEASCTCSTSEPKVCLAAFTSCEDVPTICETTADCPIYSICDTTPCGEGDTTEKRCLPLCGHSPMLP